MNTVRKTTSSDPLRGMSDMAVTGRIEIVVRAALRETENSHAKAQRRKGGNSTIASALAFPSARERQGKSPLAQFDVIPDPSRGTFGQGETRRE
jgi:hypothetical protein